MVCGQNKPFLVVFYSFGPIPHSELPIWPGRGPPMLVHRSSGFKLETENSCRVTRGQTPGLHPAMSKNTNVRLVGRAYSRAAETARSRKL